MMIDIASIPHAKQRYETCGDWRWIGDNGTLSIRVSHTEEDYDFLLALHEMIEAYLCRKRGIREMDVTAFDLAFEAQRAPGTTDEPGDDPQAPYHREHFFATSIERLVAVELGVDWTAYGQRLDRLFLTDTPSPEAVP